MSEKPESTSGAWLCDGRLYFLCAAYERYLAPCSAVALFARDTDWLLVPLLAGAGGLQVKIRNARADRVIEAQEFFRGCGLEDSPQVRPVYLCADSATGGWRIQFA